ncbi:MAG: HlyC/CorC family transporter [Deltaproteobacteria bacterium]|nr:HlyC/CorC family transporter [Deltaproteobacteria bacterium]MBW2305899.1 HlyC/CorC family transporter [Deltaproteobacteria bacterium]
MSTFFFGEFILVLGLILVNGLLSGAEIAVISSRHSRLQDMASKKVRGVRTVERLKQDPARFFATVQIGITVVGSLASAVGGAFAVKEVMPWIAATFPDTLRPYSQAIAIAVIVLSISYLSLIFGELVPKSLAVRWPEPLAIKVGQPIKFLEMVARPMVAFLTASTNMILSPLGEGVSREDGIHFIKDIQYLLRHGREHGMLGRREETLIRSALYFSKQTTRNVMIPRGRVAAIPINSTLEEALQKALDAGFTRYPVYQDTLDQIRGVVHLRRLIQATRQEVPPSLETIMDPPFFVPESKNVAALMREMQTRRIPIAMVVDEFGSVEGLVSLEDILEELVGEIQDEYRHEVMPVIEINERTLMVQGSESIRSLRLRHGLTLPESSQYETLAGFVMSKLGSIPRGGEVIQEGDLKLTVTEVDRNRVAWIRIEW